MTSVFILLAVQAASPPIPDPTLVRDAWVQRELNLSPASRDALADLYDAKPDEQTAGAWRVLGGLSNAQNARLRELSIRQAGLRALLNPGVAYQVKLTDNSRARVGILFDRWGAEVGKLRTTVKVPPAPPQLPRAHALAVRAREEGALLLEYRAKIRDILTDGARARLKALGGPEPLARATSGAEILLLDERTQEALGWTLKRSRIFREKLALVGSVEGDGPEAQAARFRRDRLVRQTFDALPSAERARLATLRLGQEGPRALARPEVAERLGLSDAQRDRMEVEVLVGEAEVAEEKARIADLVATAVTDDGTMGDHRIAASGAEADLAVATVRRRRDARLLKNLSPRQLKAWQAITLAR